MLIHQVLDLNLEIQFNHSIHLPLLLLKLKKKCKV